MPNVEPNVGLYLMMWRSGPELKPKAEHLTDWPTQAPHTLGLYLSTWFSVTYYIINYKFTITKIVFFLDILSSIL